MYGGGVGGWVLVGPDLSNGRCPDSLNDGGGVRPEPWTAFES